MVNDFSIFYHNYMNTQQIQQIIEKLAEATGLTYSAERNKADLVEQHTVYSSSTIPQFLEDLSRYGRTNDLTLLVNNLPLDSFNQLLELSEHPILFFEKSRTGLVPILAGRDSKGKKLSWSADSKTHHSAKNPFTFESNPDPIKNGQVLFVTAFPMEPLVSNQNTLHDGQHAHLSPTKRLLRLLGNERKDIGYIYFYAIVVGLISLILPLGVGSIFNLVSSGMVFSSVYVLMGLVLLGLIGSGIMQIIQVTLVEILQRRIFAKAAFEFSYRIPRFKYEGLQNSNPTELMNRFFDVLTIQKALPKFLIDITAAALQIIFGLLLLSFYHPFFIAFSSIVLVVFLGIVRLNGNKGLETSIKESKYKYRVVAWLEAIASTLFAFKSAGTTNLGFGYLFVNRTSNLIGAVCGFRNRNCVTHGCGRKAVFEH